jgi:hypothetical protein
MKGTDIYWIIADMLYVACVLAVVVYNKKKEREEREEKEKKEFMKNYIKIWGKPQQYWGEAQQYGGQKTKKRAQLYHEKKNTMKRKT